MENEGDKCIGGRRECALLGEERRNESRAPALLLLEIRPYRFGIRGGGDIDSAEDRRRLSAADSGSFLNVNHVL